MVVDVKASVDSLNIFNPNKKAPGLGLTWVRINQVWLYMCLSETGSPWNHYELRS